MRKNKYTKEILEPIIKESKTFSEVIRRLTNSDKVHGGMVDYIKKIAIDYEIDYSHFIGRAWSGGLRGLAFNAMTVTDLFKNYLTKNSIKKTCNNNIKNWIFKLNVLPKKCVMCGSDDTWNGLPLVLQLDHIDGDNSNNEITNLRILCPNCHSQTHNYAGKKNGR